MKKRNMPETTAYHKDGEVGFLTYRSLDGFPWLVNAFSTREGGVSEGCFASMNLSRTVGDDPEKINENFRIFGRAIGIDPRDMVYADQTHTDHVMRVGAEEKGMGTTRKRAYHDVDGLVTNEPGVCLVTSFADCVPLYFADPVCHAIGLTHSGWRGTVAKIGAKTIRMMEEEFGTDPSDLVCCIGPCIEKACYEVSGDVASEFARAYRKEQYQRICRQREGAPEKYLLDLPQANFEQFVDCGVLPQNISLPDLCTSCNHDFLHSHRASGGRRGGMCAFLCIKDTM